jgi:AAA domain
MNEAAFTTERFIPSAAPLKLKSNGTEKRAVVFKSASVFCAEYVPLSYTVEPIIRSSALYCLTAPTGAGKTAFKVITALAIATGRADILGREVGRGRVAYLACENPNDIRMRIMIAAYLLNIDIGEVDHRLVILDRREKPEDVHEELSRLARTEPFAFILIDTLAASSTATTSTMQCRAASSSAASVRSLRSPGYRPSSSPRIP